LHQRIKIRRRKGPDWRSREAGPSTPPEVKVTARATTTLFGSPAASQSTPAQGEGHRAAKTTLFARPGREPLGFAPKAKVTARAKTTLFARRQTTAERQTPPKAPQAPFGQIIKAPSAPASNPPGSRS
jgi:hypothetical protein